MIWTELLSRVDRWPDRVALRVGQRRVTYSELAGIVEAIGRPWQASGQGPIRRALIKHADPATVLVYILACWRSGVVPVVMRDNAPDAQVVQLIGCLRPDLRLFDRVDLDAVTPVAWRPRETRPRKTQPRETPRFGKRDEALVLSTSGTTCSPKLVAIPAEAVCINARAIAASLELSEEDRLVVNTPLTYMYGLMGGTMAGLWSGAAVHLFPSWVPPSVVQARIRSERLTVFQSPPSMYRIFTRYWSGEPFPSVRMATTGGEFLGEDSADEIVRMFPRAKRRFLYGMTEAGPRISHDDLDAGRYLDGRVGKPYSHIEWRTEPLEDRSLPANVGRLVLRGPSLFLGYLQPATGDYLGIDDEGWFHSSDLASTDEAGRLYFRGRIDRLFKTGGKLVNPAAVERILASHPGVCAARCRTQSHELLGLALVAEVAVVPGSRVAESDLRLHCQAHLDAHAVPRRISLCEELPMAASGKMDLKSAA